MTQCSRCVCAKREISKALGLQAVNYHSERAHLSFSLRHSCRRYGCSSLHGQTAWSMGHALHMKHTSADLRPHSFLLSYFSSGIECSSKKRLRLNVLSSSAGDSRVPPEADVHYRRSGVASKSPACMCMSGIPSSMQQMHLIALQARLVCAACLHFSTGVPALPCSRSSLYHTSFCFACPVSICLTLVSTCMVMPSIDASAVCGVPVRPDSPG